MNTAFSRGRLVSFCLCIAALAAPSVVRADPAAQGTGLAVMQFRIASTARGSGGGLGVDLQDSLHTFLTTSLRGKSITLIERARLRELLEENKKSDTGLIDPAEAVRVGGKAGARYVLLGTITELETVRESELEKQETKDAAGAEIGSKAVGQVAERLVKNLRLPGALRGLTGGGGRQREEPQVALLTLEARIVSISSADGEASFQVQGVSRGKRPSYAMAVSDAAKTLAEQIAASIREDGRIQPPPPDVVAKGRKVSKLEKGLNLAKGLKRGKKDDAPPSGPNAVPAAPAAPGTPATPVSPTFSSLEGRILAVDTDEEIAVKLSKDHGVKAGAKLKMRWVQAVEGDNTLRKTKAAYRVEVVSVDVGGVFVKVLAVLSGSGLPEKNESVILEPDKE